LTFTKKRKFANLEKKTRKWSSTNKEYTKSKNSNAKHLELNISTLNNLDAATISASVAYD
jgi:hypothetical protein